jgi:ABC-type antimicrobial peptide transport system permease subunit
MVQLKAPVESVKGPLLAAWRNADPREPVPDLKTVPQLVADETSDTRANAFVLGALALLALLLAISGTASVAAYAIARRTNEIGVRMALGARRWRIVRTLLVSAATMLVIGLVAGLGLAALAANSLSPQLYQTPPYDPVTYVGVALILTTATLFASFIPAYRASTMHPSNALRYE